MTVGCYTSLQQIKHSVAFELGVTDKIPMRLFTHRGRELAEDRDVGRLKDNGMVFAALGSSFCGSVDEGFDCHNFLVPYERIKMLGEVTLR